MRPATAREPGELFGPRFALFADGLVPGLATTVAALSRITPPAALSTARAVLDRRVHHDEPATAGHHAAALRARLRPGDLLAGAAALGGLALLPLNAAITGAGLPALAARAVAQS